MVGRTEVKTVYPPPVERGYNKNKYNNITYQMHTDKSQYQTPNHSPPSLQRLHLSPMHLDQNLQIKIKVYLAISMLLPYHTPKTLGNPPLPTNEKVSNIFNSK